MKKSMRCDEFSEGDVILFFSQLTFSRVTVPGKGRA